MLIFKNLYITKLKLTTMKQDLLQKPQVSEIGQHIGYEAGEEMAKRFFDKHPDLAYGNVVGRSIIEKILAQPDCAGLIIIPGYNEMGIRQSILVGIDSERSPILKYSIVNSSGEVVNEEGIVADRFEPDWSSKNE
jgi:hypothetical protein